MDLTDLFINIHAHQITAPENITVLNIYSGEGPDFEIKKEIASSDTVYYSVGIHPWNIGKSENQAQTLSQLASLPKVIVVGECGLDINARSSLSVQEIIFRQHIEISESLKKPLIIHCVRCFNELIRIRKDSRSVQPWIIHGFNANEEIAHQCRQHHMLFSFGGSLLTENSNSERVARNIPVSEVFLETDDRNLTISSIYRAYALLKGDAVDSIKMNMAENFKRCFKI